MTKAEIEAQEELEAATVETEDVNTETEESTESVTGDTQHQNVEGEIEALEKELSEADTEAELESIAFKLKNKEKQRANNAEETVEQLKAKLKARDDEFELLKAATTKPKEKAARPDPFDFDDDAQYDKALAEYEHNNAVEIARKIRNEEIQNEQKNATIRQLQEAQSVIEDKHIQRAAKFIQGSDVSADDYAAAQTVIEESFGEGLAAEIMDFDNSEIIMYQLGKNPKKVQEFISLFNQPNGAAKAFREFTRYADSLGKVELKETLEPDQKRESGAAAGESDFHKRIDVLRQNGAPMSEILALKREGRAAGLDIP